MNSKGMFHRKTQNLSVVIMNSHKAGKSPGLALRNELLHRKYRQPIRLSIM
jgi:hypothetical protein